MTSALALAMRVRFPLLALLTTLLAVMTHACGHLPGEGPDECEPNDNTCDGNVANLCLRQGLNSKLEIKREDCGDSKVCVMAVDARTANYYFGSTINPGCVRKEFPTCETAGALSCNGDASTTCADLTDGRRVWVEYLCPDGCNNGRCT